MLALPSAAGAAGWTAVTGAISGIQEVGSVRAPDGTLHVVWIRETPNSGGATDDLLQVAISPSGAVGSPTAVAPAFGSLSNPAIVNTTGGGLEVFFGGISGNVTGLFTSTSRDGGATWTAPTLVLNADQAYASDVNAATLSDGTPFETWSHTSGVTVHRGLDPATADFDYRGALTAGCCGYQGNLAADGAGGLQLAWYSTPPAFSASGAARSIRPPAHLPGPPS